MLSFFFVKEQSMKPSFKESDFVVAMRYIFSRPRVGDVIVIKHIATRRLLLKRITMTHDKQYWIEGDNKRESHDSRHFGWIGGDEISGKVIACVSR